MEKYAAIVIMLVVSTQLDLAGGKLKSGQLRSAFTDIEMSAQIYTSLCVAQVIVTGDIDKHLFTEGMYTGPCKGDTDIANWVNLLERCELFPTLSNAFLIHTTHSTIRR